MKESKNMNQSKKAMALLVVGGVLAVVLLVIVIRRANTITTQTSTSSNTAAQLQAGKVSITTTGFEPASITVKEGDTVTWTNTDAAMHQIATDPYPLENGLAGFRSTTPTSQNSTYAFTFKKAGTYTYHDHLDPFKFKGTVVVK